MLSREARHGAPPAQAELANSHRLRHRGGRSAYCRQLSNPDVAEVDMPGVERVGLNADVAEERIVTRRLPTAGLGVGKAGRLLPVQPDRVGVAHDLDLQIIPFPGDQGRPALEVLLPAVAADRDVVDRAGRIVGSSLL